MALPSSGSDESSEQDGDNNSSNCAALAHALIHNKQKEVDHFYYSIRGVQQAMPPTAANATILVIRTRHMWDDWISANAWLGQKEQTVAIFPNLLHRQQNETKLPVTKDISDKGKRRLCFALRFEYREYFSLLQRAVNLDQQNLQDAYKLAKQNCPQLVQH